MHFLVVPRSTGFTVPSSLPALVLRRDLWDDFGFETMFDAYLYPSRTEASIDLGSVKIIKRGQQGGATEMPDSFIQLDDSYCSLGQAFSYYEALHGLPGELRDSILFGLRDIAIDPSLRESFANEPAMAASLLRYGNAELALRDATALFGGAMAPRDSALAFTFRTSVGGEPFPIHFGFADRHPLPGRINVVVGYNGCGKTQLLANLANTAHADLTDRADESFIRRYGEFPEGASAPRFSSVIAISYSAFDTFDLPGKNRQEEDRLQSSGEVSGYTYCGLRRYDRSLSPDAPRTGSLKGAEEIQGDIMSALVRASTPERKQRLAAALSPLSREPSFKRVELSDTFAFDSDSWRDSFSGLSTGHKLVLNIVVQLVAHLEPGSLVLIDEPESHLHPPLLAALLKSINISLDQFNSYAVMATHSPVLLQEVPRRYVRVLQRFGDLTLVATPEIETFAENVGLLTRHVFNLDSSATDYHSTLRSMQESLHLDEIMELFDGEMSAQSISYLASISRDRPAR
ncbi:AAA family ATPase [Streptomyces sp. NRRL F-5135]|uniref:AAA family ATPase n=1 Tax=Streptomyces sp. NRRL F-5135 TaxID=1463858 RepID=UPI00099D7299|nr:AAA family ATPase [Streptomyces sp. NRRL F-5135]